VAKYADMWNAMGSVDKLRHKVEVLREHCAAVGRDPDEIEFTLGIKATIRDSAAEATQVWKRAMAHNRTPLADVETDDTFWTGTPEQLAERLAPYVELGFRTVISEQPAPYDGETLERLIGQVGPLAKRMTATPA
jgi:alkanesulfonate monooxygenase SsuD/methylene tetrahydromethanopterin reductase-like flavin-dependent oxidoreductase (luciferase family)